MAKKLTKGLFITFEGPEGCGKSTHSSRIAEELKGAGYDVLRTLEPGGTELGKRIREVLLIKEDIPLEGGAEFLLFEADRAQHVREVILPAVEEGKVVICDRFNTSTFAYQGYGLGMDMDMVFAVDDVSTGGLKPDLTVLLDVDAATGLERAGKAGTADRMEKRDLAFHEKVRAGFLDLAEKDPARVKVVEVRDDIEETYALVKELVDGLIERYKGTE